MNFASKRAAVCALTGAMVFAFMMNYSVQSISCRVWPTQYVKYSAEASADYGRRFMSARSLARLRRVGGGLRPYLVGAWVSIVIGIIHRESGFHLHGAGQDVA